MPRYVIAGGVLLLLVVVGAVFLVIALTNNADPGDGSNPTKGAGRVAVVENVQV